MKRAWIGGCALVVFAAFLGTSTNVLCADRLLDKARKRYDFFEYAEALELLNLVLAKEKLVREDRHEALTLKARILVGYGCDARAIKAYHALLELDPAFALPRDESPKVRECFDLARESLPASKPAADPAPITAVAPPPTDAGPTTPPDPGVETRVEPAGVAPWVWVAGGAAAVAAIVGGVLLYNSLASNDPIRGSAGHVDGWPP